MKPSRYCYTDNRDSAELVKVSEAEIKALRAEVQRLKTAITEANQRIARQAVTIEQRQLSWHKMAQELKWKDEVIAELQKRKSMP